MKHQILRFLLIGSILASPCAKALTTQQDFHRVELTGSIKALLTSQQDHHLVTLSGPEEQLEHVTVSNHNGTLSIVDRNRYTPAYPPMVVAKINAKKLQSVKLSGNNRCMIESIKNYSMDVQISGKSQCSMAGSTQHLKLHHTGHGYLYAEHLNAKQATISSSGSSHSYVQVRQQLKASASGASIIKYYGQPQLTLQHSGHAKISAVKTPDKNSYQGEMRLHKSLLDAYHNATTAKEQ